MLQRGPSPANPGSLAQGPRLGPDVLARLWVAALLLTLGDYLSTFYAVELTGRPLVEANVVARLSLEMGGWPLLLAKDVTGALVLGGLLLAYYRLKGRSSSRARVFAFGVLLLYALPRLGAVINNVLLASV